MISRRRFTQAGLAALALPSFVTAAPFTTQPIRLIVPTSPSTGIDETARFLQTYLSRQWDSPVVVENKAGAGSRIATDFTAKSPADGTVVLMTTSAHFTFPYLVQTLSFDPVRDFDPVAQLILGVLAVVVPENSPFNTIQDLIAEGRRNPGKIFFGSSGIGSPTHLAGALFGKMAEMEITHVPYKDASQVIIDVMGGQLQFAVAGTSTAMPLIQSGKLRALAVTGLQRAPALADVPTLDEAGLRGLDVTSPILALTRAGTPPDTVAEISRMMIEAANTSEFKKMADKLGYVLDLQDAATLRTNRPGEFLKWKQLVEISGATPL